MGATKPSTPSCGRSARASGACASDPRPTGEPAMHDNAYRVRAEHGDVQLGTWVTMIRTPAVLTLLKAAGLDFARVDMEHSPFSMETVADMATLARALDFPLVVRPPEGNREWITRLLDAGVWNLHVPQVDTPEQAAEVAACSRYAPLGERGMYGFGPHTMYRTLPPGEHMAEANARVHVTAMLESRRAFERLDEIAAAPGIDALTIGPTDLAQNRGVPALGAAVIKIEPPRGDPYRVRGAGYPPSAYNYPWIVDNRSKRAVAVDLRAEEGRDVLYRLVRTADVFVTNLPFDARGRLRVRWEDLAPLNARLIYASLTAYGETGPEAGRPGFDSIALWARTGLMDLVRPSPESPPARALPGMGDHPTGMSLFGAILAALYPRERTGRGGMVSTSLMANGLWWNAIQVQGILCGARTPTRPAREDAASALANLYRCRDGRWFLMTITGAELHWDAFARCIERADLITDPRFATVTTRRTNVRALVAILDEVFATKDWAEWRRILETSGIVFGVLAQ